MSYIGVVCLLILLCAIFQVHPMFLTDKWQSKRLVLFSSVAAFGFLPFIHWCIVSSQETVMVRQVTDKTSVSILFKFVVQLFYPKVLILYMIGSVGALFYATKFPEILIPGWKSGVYCSVM